MVFSSLPSIPLTEASVNLNSPEYGGPPDDLPPLLPKECLVVPISVPKEAKEPAEAGLPKETPVPAGAGLPKVIPPPPLRKPVHLPVKPKKFDGEPEAPVFIPNLKKIADFRALSDSQINLMEVYLNQMVKILGCVELHIKEVKILEDKNNGLIDQLKSINVDLKSYEATLIYLTNSDRNETTALNFQIDGVKSVTIHCGPEENLKYPILYKPRAIELCQKLVTDAKGEVRNLEILVSENQNKLAALKIKSHEVEYQEFEKTLKDKKDLLNRLSRGLSESKKPIVEKKTSGRDSVETPIETFSDPLDEMFMQQEIIKQLPGPKQTMLMNGHKSADQLFRY